MPTVQKSIRVQEKTLKEIDLLIKQHERLTEDHIRKRHAFLIRDRR